MSNIKEDKSGPVDLQKKKLARDLENQIGGIFGIEREDIEKAIDRLWSGEIPCSNSETDRINLSDPLKRVIQALDLLESAVSEAGEDPATVSCIRELIPFYVNRIESLLLKRKEQ